MKTICRRVVADKRIGAKKVVRQRSTLTRHQPARSQKPLCLDLGHTQLGLVYADLLVKINMP